MFTVTIWNCTTTYKPSCSRLFKKAFEEDKVRDKQTEHAVGEMSLVPTVQVVTRAFFF